MNRSHDAWTSRPARLAGRVLAGAFVAGIAALVAFQAGMHEQAPAVPLAPEFLRAPATDPSVPAAEHVFAASPAIAATPVPTF